MFTIFFERNNVGRRYVACIPQPEMTYFCALAELLVCLMDKTVFTYASSDDELIRRFLIRSIEVLTGRRYLERLYTEYRSAPAPRDEG